MSTAILVLRLVLFYYCYYYFAFIESFVSCRYVYGILSIELFVAELRLLSTIALLQTN